MTLHQKYNTTTERLTASDIAKWILCAFPAAVLLAMTFWPMEVLPWFVRMMDHLH